MALISGIIAAKPSMDRVDQRHAGNAAAAESRWEDNLSPLLRCIQSQKNDPGRTSYAVGIVGCSGGQGVTTAAANLALVAARNGVRRVLLIDANTSNPGLASHFRVPTTPGLTEILSGEALLGDALQATQSPSLRILAAGGTRKQLGVDFDLQQFSNLLDELKAEFDLIIVDMPAAHEMSECYAVADALDGIFLVVAANRVDCQIARRVTQRLAHGRARLLGAIYNQLE